MDSWTICRHTGRYVTGPRHPRLDEIGGRYITADKNYHFTANISRDTITAVVDELNAYYANIRAKATEQAPAVAEPVATPAPATPASTQRPGWSKAARRRAGHTSRDHALGTYVRSEGGATIYRDDLTGRGTVRIYDES